MNNVLEMKARVYDLSVLLQQTQQEINLLNAEIAKLTQTELLVDGKISEMAKEQAGNVEGEVNGMPL